MHEHLDGGAGEGAEGRIGVGRGTRKFPGLEPLSVIGFSKGVEGEAVGWAAGLGQQDEARVLDAHELRVLDDAFELDGLLPAGDEIAWLVEAAGPECGLVTMPAERSGSAPVGVGLRSADFGCATGKLCGCGWKQKREQGCGKCESHNSDTTR